MKRGFVKRAAVVAASTGGVLAATIGVAGAAHADWVPDGYVYVTNYSHYDQCTHYGQVGVDDGSWTAYVCIHSGPGIPGYGPGPGALYVKY